MAQPKKAPKARPILVTDDLNHESSHGTRSRAVRNAALGLSRRIGSTVDFLHVEELSAILNEGPGLGPLYKDYIRDRKERFAAEVRASGAAGARQIFKEGDPVSEILKLASKKPGYEMVVLGTHGRTGLSRVILGSVAEEVLRHAQSPIMTVGPKAQGGLGPDFFDGTTRLVVAADLTKSSATAVGYALRLAAQLRAEVTLVHVLYETFHPMIQTALSTPANVKALESVVSKARVAAQKKLAAIERQFKAWDIACQTRVEDKPMSADEAILSELRRNPKGTVAVLGTHRRTFLKNALLGSTARQVILESPTPVITVRG